jgi:hypothetical protein
MYLPSKPVSIPARTDKVKRQRFHSHYEIHVWTERRTLKASRVRVRDSPVVLSSCTSSPVPVT